VPPFDFGPLKYFQDDWMNTPNNSNKFGGAVDILAQFIMDPAIYLGSKYFIATKS